MDNSKRALHWDGCQNVRELGDLPTIDGNRTRRGALIRADLLGRLTAKGKQQLLDYGVTTIVDLRAPQEITANPPPAFGRHPCAPQYINPPPITPPACCRRS